MIYDKELLQDDDLILKVKNLEIVIKHNDVGVSIDVWKITEEENFLIKSIQHWFDEQ